MYAIRSYYDARGLAYVHRDKLGKARQALAALRKAAADPALEGKTRELLVQARAHRNNFV